MQKEFANMLVVHRTFVIPYLLLLIAGIIALTTFSKEELFVALNSARAPGADFFFKYWTHVGDGVFFAFVGVLVLFYRFGYSLMLLLSLLVSGVIVQVLKKLVFSEALRPKGWFGSETLVQTIEGVTLHSFNSFPSGHTTTAFAMMFGLALIIQKKQFGYLLVLAAALVGYSRIYLGQHFFEDVFYGSLVGVFQPPWFGYFFNPGSTINGHKNHC
jgi:membrane-associated phospholipid phosphatase